MNKDELCVSQLDEIDDGDLTDSKDLGETQCPYCSEPISTSYIASHLGQCECPHCHKLLSAEVIPNDSEYNKNMTSIFQTTTSSSTDNVTVMSENSYNPSNVEILPMTEDYITFTTDQSTGDKVIKFATLEMVVQMITSNDLTDPYFVECFLHAYQLVCDADKLLDLIIERYDLPRGEMKWNDFVQKVLDPVRMKVISFIYVWLKEGFDDFDKDMLNKTIKLLERYEKDKPKAARIILNYIQKATAERNTKMPVKCKSETSPCLLTSQNPRLDFDFHHVMDPEQQKLFAYHYEEFARTLTKMQEELFLKIKTVEFLKQGWLKKNKEKSPNIRAMIHNSNMIASTIQSIILSIDNAKGRAIAIHYFINVSSVLQKLNNFDGLKSVMAGLSSASIYRLSKSWKFVPEKTKAIYKALEEVVSQEGNFAKLRTLTKLCCPPSIPFLGSTLTDLVFTSEGNNDMDEEKIKFNFFKIRSIGNLIKEIKIKQSTQYPFNANEDLLKIITNLMNTAITDEDKLYEKSTSLESRDSIGSDKEIKKEMRKSKSLLKTYTKALNKSVSFNIKPSDDS